jgi:hypothetical protein
LEWTWWIVIFLQIITELSVTRYQNIIKFKSGQTANADQDCFLKNVRSICQQKNRNTEADGHGGFCWLLAPIGALGNNKQPIFLFTFF